MQVPSKYISKTQGPPKIPFTFYTYTNKSDESADIYEMIFIAAIICVNLLYTVYPTSFAIILIFNVQSFLNYVLLFIVHFQNLYPELEDEDESDPSDKQCKRNLNHRDRVRKEGELKKDKGNLYEELNNTLEEVDKSKKEKVFNLSNATSTIYLIFLFLIILVAGVYLFPRSKPAVKLSIKEKLQNMQNLFKDQNHFTFRVLEKALDKVVNVTQEPSAPAIITVTVNKNARYKSHEFSLYLARALAPQSTIFINESVAWNNNPNDIKLKIDDEIKSVAKEEKLFVVVVDNLQNIPLESAMIFHSYCDHEAAPFKTAVFLFIVPLDRILPKDISRKEIDRAAFQQLKNIWSKATPDEIDSLITRITVNVINITH